MEHEKNNILYKYVILVIMFTLSACDLKQNESVASVSEGSARQLTITDLSYQGGFRLSSSTYGDSSYPTLSYSPGAMAYNKVNNSLFVVGHAYEQGIAEFVIPEIINSRDMNDFVVGDEIIQSFSPLYGSDRVSTGIDSYFRITGMEKINNSLVVNYFSWYDAPGAETDTSVVYQDASDLDNSNITGPFQLQGAAHAGGWLTFIPIQYQSELGGTYVSGWSSGSIISRLSVGPSAFVLTPEDSLLVESGGGVDTTAVLDFSLNNMLYDTDKHPDGVTSTSAILYNDDLNNDLWTISSKATYGFIVEDTGTYITVGGSAGHESGLGYKITQDNGTLCGGPCAYHADDVYNYYWLWHVSDLIKVKNGELEPWEVRPYEYGQLNLPIARAVSGGAYDKDEKLLYLSVAQGDTVQTYARPPLFFVFKIQ